MTPDPKRAVDAVDAFEEEMEAEFGAFLDEEEATSAESEDSGPSDVAAPEAASLSAKAAELLADLDRVQDGMRSLRGEGEVSPDTVATLEQRGALEIKAGAGGLIAVTRGVRQDPPLTPIALGALGVGAVAGVVFPVAYAVPIVGFGAALLIAANERDATTRPSVRERVLKGELTLEPAEQGYRDGARRYFAKLDGQPLGVESVRRVCLRTVVPKDPGSPRWESLVLELEHHSIELSKVPNSRSRLQEVAQELANSLRVEVVQASVRAEVDTTGAVGLSVVGVGTGVIAGALLAAVLPAALAAVSVAAGAVTGGLAARALYRRALGRALEEEAE